MPNNALSPEQRRNKRIYGIAFILFAAITITDLLLAPTNILKVSGSLALAAGWFLLFWFYPFITGRRKNIILAAFVVSLSLLVIRLLIQQA